MGETRVMPRLSGAFDWRLLTPIFGLTVFGLLTLTSIAPSMVNDQLKFTLIGILSFILVSLIDYQIYRRFTPFFYLLSLIILLTTAFFGISIRGAERWLAVGPLTFQSSEAIKPLIILFLSGYLSETNNGQALKAIVAGLLILALILLIFFQPDLGTGFVIFLIWLGMILAFGISWSWLIAGLVLSGVVLPLFWQFLKEYQKERVLTFFNPLRDPLGAGYNVIQSVIAIGSGQLFGRGLGQGPQSHLRFLPERQTDFIFASFSEEWGFLGSIFLLLLFFLLLSRLLEIARQTTDNFASLIVVGVFSMIFFQAIINIGMNLGILPITGITLPLISMGGSSFISVMVGLGVVQNVARQLEQKKIEYW